MEHKDALGDIIEAGKSSALNAAFRNVAEVTTAAGNPKYSDNVLKSLARTIACRSYATSVLQLCHLVNAADALGRGPERYERLFFDGKRAAAASFQGHISDAVARRGWRRPGFDQTGQSITIEYADGRFEIYYSRMAFLCALFDFLLAAGSYGEADQIFSKMLSSASSEGAVKEAANAVSRQIYHFLGANAASAQNMQKFRRIIDFLRGRGDAGEIIVDDAAILGFWRKYSVQPQGEAGDFRVYRTVLDAFVPFVRALGSARERRAVDRAATIGGNREEGEIDPNILSEALEVADEWQSPLRACDVEPMSGIKFLTKKERQTIDLVLECGPEALRLPISVLRAETFGKTQARLTQARRAKSGDLDGLIGGAETASYRDCETGYRTVMVHLLKVVQAALYALSRSGEQETSGNVVALSAPDPMAFFKSYESDTCADAPEAGARTMEQARKAFEGFARKGFDEDGLDDPDIAEGFEVGAGAMTAAKAHLDDFLSILAEHDKGEPDLAGLFANDRATFSEQFQRLYGDAS